MTRFANFALAAVTSLGLALTPISATAAPDGEDYAKVLGGLFILGAIANAANDRDERPALRARPIIEQDRYRDRRVIDGEYYRPGDRARQRIEHKLFRFKQVALPVRCERVLRTSRGDRLVYGRHCLNRNYRHASRLPQACERQVRTDRGIRTFYAARCLRRDGWRVAGR